jgi:hypothetical protein
MSHEISKPKPFLQCDECCGPNGYHSSTCSRAVISDAAKFESSLTPADFKFLRDMRVGLEENDYSFPPASGTQLDTSPAG